MTWQVISAGSYRGEVAVGGRTCGAVGGAHAHGLNLARRSEAAHRAAKPDARVRVFEKHFRMCTEAPVQCV
jgi:hypothetical protein